jgi:polyhydroxyalkanoate synthesis regulator phasin
LCKNAGVVIDEKTKANKMNDDLAKAGKYNVSKQKQITAWLGLRNDAAHGHWDRYTEKEVEAMINGVNNFIADYLR